MITHDEVLPSNKFEERSREFTIKRIVSMADLAQEKALVPEFPGLSNVESCKDWRFGMPMDEALLEDKPNEEILERAQADTESAGEFVDWPGDMGQSIRTPHRRAFHGYAVR